MGSDLAEGWIIRSKQDGLVHSTVRNSVYLPTSLLGGYFCALKQGDEPMSNNAYIQQLSMTQWGKASKPSGSVVIKHDAGSMTFELDDDDASKLAMVASAIVDKHKKKFAEQVATVDTTPLIAYDGDKTIDNDDIQF